MNRFTNVRARYFVAAAAAATVVIARPVIAQVRTPLPKTKSVILRSVVSQKHGYSDSVIAQIRIIPPKVKSVILKGYVAHRAKGGKPVHVRPRWTLPTVHSFIGKPSTLVAPPTIKAKPVVVLRQSLIPKIRSFVGIYKVQPVVVATSQSRAKPITILVRIKSFFKSFIGQPRYVTPAPVIPPVIPPVVHPTTGTPIYTEVTEGTAIFTEVVEDTTMEEFDPPEVADDEFGTEQVPATFTEVVEYENTAFTEVSEGVVWFGPSEFDPTEFDNDEFSIS